MLNINVFMLNINESRNNVFFNHKIVIYNIVIKKLTTNYKNVWFMKQILSNFVLNQSGTLSLDLIHL